jgi:hypothetical protein
MPGSWGKKLFNSGNEFSIPNTWWIAMACIVTSLFLVMISFCYIGKSVIELVQPSDTQGKTSNSTRFKQNYPLGFMYQLNQKKKSFIYKHFVQVEDISLWYHFGDHGVWGDFPHVVGDRDCIRHVRLHCTLSDNYWLFWALWIPSLVMDMAEHEPEDFLADIVTRYGEQTELRCSNRICHCWHCVLLAYFLWVVSCWYAITWLRQWPRYVLSWNFGI